MKFRNRFDDSRRRSRASRRIQIVVYAKAPRLGQVKTRLARDLGDVRTLVLYRGLLGRLVRKLRRDPRLALTVFVGPPHLERGVRRLLPPVSTSKQRYRDLGEGMIAAAREVGSRRNTAFVIGTDIPDIEPHHLVRAHAMLRSHDVVFGPSGDGGYWLIGLTASAMRTLDLSVVRWSGPHTLSDSTAGARAMRIAYADTLDDIDEIEDYRRWRARTKHAK